jgi:hypothetical protein
VTSQLRAFVAAVALLGAISVNCAPAPRVPERPTWADVEPILRAECTSCHGGSAAVSGSSSGISYRLDLYDMTRDACGDAALPTEGLRFAAAAAPQIAADITSDAASIRPRMPPEPSPWLADWEWQTLLRWASAPVKGPRPPGDRAPIIRVTSPTRVVKKHFILSVVLEDPDGEAAVGVVTIGDGQVTLRMDRPGAFAIEIDASQWGLGPVKVQGQACDGWTRPTFDLGKFIISG